MEVLEFGMGVSEWEMWVWCGVVVAGRDGRRRLEGSLFSFLMEWFSNWGFWAGVVIEDGVGECSVVVCFR